MSDILQRKLPTTEYLESDMALLKQWVKNKWAVFEAELLQAIEEWKSENWEKLNAKTMIDFYIDTMNNATKRVPWVIWEVVDHQARSNAADKLLKIMTWMLWTSKQTTINLQSNTLNMWQNIPDKSDHLIY